MFNRISDLITDYLSTLEKELKLKTIKIRELDAKKNGIRIINMKLKDAIEIAKDGGNYVKIIKTMVFK